MEGNQRILNNKQSNFSPNKGGSRLANFFLISPSPFFRTWNKVADKYITDMVNTLIELANKKLSILWDILMELCLFVSSFSFFDYGGGGGGGKFNLLRLGSDYVFMWFAILKSQHEVVGAKAARKSFFSCAGIEERKREVSRFRK